MIVVVVAEVAGFVVVVVEMTFDWVVWDFVFGSVRRMGCSLDCRRDHGLVLHWALLFWAPISVKGSRIVIWV